MSPCTGQWARPAAICAVVAAVLLQLGLMTALYNVESDAAALAAASGGSSASGALARQYCTVSDDSTYGLDLTVNTALAQGCALVGGASVGGGDDSRGNKIMTFVQAMMCHKGTGCAK